MRPLWEIARLQWLESWRRQHHWLTLVCSLAMALLPLYVSQFSAGLNAYQLVSKDFGLSLINYYTVILALVTGSSVLHRDLERKTIYPLLARPIGRFSYVTGQFCGAAANVVISAFSMSLALFLGLAWLSGFPDWGLLGAGLSYALEGCLITALCVAWSTVASPPLAGVLTTLIYVLGSLPRAFIDFFLRDDRGAPWLANAVEAAKEVLPLFEIYGIKYPVVYAFRIDPAYYGAEILYTAAWASVFLLLAGLRFQLRDLA